MNGNDQREFIDKEMDRLITEADGDGWLALRISIVERLSLGVMVSSGFGRLKPPRKPRSPRKQIQPLDVPSGPEAENPNS